MARRNIPTSLRLKAPVNRTLLGCPLATRVQVNLGCLESTHGVYSLVFVCAHMNICTQAQILFRKALQALTGFCGP